MTRTALFLCDETGNMARPWAAAGYACTCVDVQHSIRRTHVEHVGTGSIAYVWGDVRSWWPERLDVDFVAAFPPCTHLAASGARDWKQKGLALLIDALTLVEACRRICEATAAPYQIENPVGRLSTIWRPPDHWFDPCDYADYLDNPAEEAYTKRTGLWTGGGFVMPVRRAVVPVLGSRMHTLPGGASLEKTAIRSATPRGFALACYLANAPHLRRVEAA